MNPNLNPDPNPNPNPNPSPNPDPDPEHEQVGRLLLLSAFNVFICQQVTLTLP